MTNNQIKVGDFLTLNQDVIIAYDHSVSSKKLNKGDRLQVRSIAVANPKHLTLSKEGVSNNIGLTTNFFNI